MGLSQIVIDSNVIVSGLRSSLGASNKLLGLIGLKHFEMNLSVPLVIEYEKALFDHKSDLPYSRTEIIKILDYICSNSKHIVVHYLWRPFLKDPRDDMVLELAVASGSKYIISFNHKDFVGSEQFGISLLYPKDFLKKIGVK